MVIVLEVFKPIHIIKIDSSLKWPSKDYFDRKIESISTFASVGDP